MSDAFFLGGFSLQILQHVLLDLPGILFFTTYTLLVLFWAEIYHQVFYSDAYFHPAGMYVLLFHKARGVCDLFHFCDGQDSRLILRFLFCFRLEASLLINCAQPFSSQMQQFTLFRCVLEKQNSLIWWNEGPLIEYRSVVKDKFRVALNPKVKSALQAFNCFISSMFSLEGLIMGCISRIL